LRLDTLVYGALNRQFLGRDSIYSMLSALYARQSVRPSHGSIIEQESCAIAKMTAQCALRK